jgi:hypothetical protein
MSTLTVLSVTPNDDASNGLAPAPNVSETMYIKDILDKDTTPPITNLTEAQLTALTSYRGWTLYCAGGVTIQRYNPHPSSTCGNGLISRPASGAEEDVCLMSSVGRFNARVRFD